MGETTFAVWIETGGKQRYIFGTNKLREIVGASQIVALSTQDWLSDAVSATQAAFPAATIEVVVAISGQALVTVTDEVDAEEAAKRLVREVTTHALRSAPGLVVTGAVERIDHTQAVDAAMRRTLIGRVEANRRALPPAEARLQRLPVGASCRTGDGPASRWFDDASGDGSESLSASSIAKRLYNQLARDDNAEAVEHGVFDEGQEIIPGAGSITRPKEFEAALTGSIRWLAVVHADGNGIGSLVSRDMNQDHYARFCRELDLCTRQALVAAARTARRIRDQRFPDRRNHPLPMVPLVASGDDMTTLIDGCLAVPFTIAYLRAFEAYSADPDSAIGEVLKAAYPGAASLTASAGVAVVKPHFPFPHAWHLCEQACDSAKRLAKHLVRQPGSTAPETSGANDGDGSAVMVSALDWHVHYDASGADLDAVRARAHADNLVPPQGIRMLRRPYVVTAGPKAVPSPLEGRDIAALEQLVDEIPVQRHPDPGQALPMSQLAALRERIVDAVGGQDARRADQLFRTLANRRELSLLRRFGSADSALGSDGDAATDGGDTLFGALPGDPDGARAPFVEDFLDLVAESLLLPGEAALTTTPWDHLVDGQATKGEQR